MRGAGKYESQKFDARCAAGFPSGLKYSCKENMRYVSKIPPVVLYYRRCAGWNLFGFANYVGWDLDESFKGC